MINLFIYLIGMVIGFLMGWFLYKSKVIEISDNKPAENRNESVSYAMQLSNELKDYFYEKDNKICIKVVKK